MTPEEQFRSELKSTISNADPKIDRHELLTDIFKSYVAKLFEMTMLRNQDKAKDRLEYSAMVEVKRNLISEFRLADLSEYQRSEEQYSELFEETVQEILNDAALAHQGSDLLDVSGDLVAGGSFQKSGGLYLPNN